MSLTPREIEIRNALWDAGLVGEVGAERGPVMLAAYEVVERARRHARWEAILEVQKALIGVSQAHQARDVVHRLANEAAVAMLDAPR